MTTTFVLMVVAPSFVLVVVLVMLRSRRSAWQKRDDAERDAWLRARGLEVWRVRETSAALEARLRQRLA